jgi:hypothetical protein
MRSLIPVLLAVTSPLLAQDRKQAACAALVTAYENGLKELAMVTYGFPDDDSALRETMRQQQAANALKMVELNLTLMGQRGCKPPPGPISPEPYSVAAKRCGRVRSLHLESQIPKFCDMTQWKRLELWPA